MLHGNYSAIAIKSKAQKLGLCCIQKWTDREEMILYDKYSSVPMDEVMKLLPNRTYDSIVTHAKVLNLTSNYTNKNYYSEEQRQFIKNNWQKMTDKELAYSLGKVQAVLWNKDIK